MLFVEFYSTLAENCIYLKPIWADWSLKYSTKQFRFVEVDITNDEELAKEYRINTSGLSRQLPSLILFEDGNESYRFPPIDKQTGLSAKVLKWDMKMIKKYFDLDKRYLQTRDLWGDSYFLNVGNNNLYF